MGDPFTEERRYVMNLESEPVPDGWTGKRLSISFMEDGKGLDISVELSRRESAGNPRETQTVHCERYWLCSYISPNVPHHLDGRHLAEVMALIYSGRGPAVDTSLWRLFYSIVIEPAVGDPGHWLWKAAPGFATFHARAIAEQRRQNVAEVMES